MTINLKPWACDGLRVLAKQESEDNLFIASQIDEEAQKLADKTKELADLAWPSFDNLNKTHWGTYSSYYCSVLADTLKKFSYGQGSVCKTKQHKAASFAELKQKFTEQPNSSFEILNTNMLVQAKYYATLGFHVCGFNPMNENSIMGGAFVGAPNFEEDLARISELSIALVQHAREDGDFEYKASRPHYNKKLDKDALLVRDVLVIKSIEIPKGNFWYAKEFVDLPKKEQFKLSFVGNAALYLDKPRKLTTAEYEVTETRMRSQLTAMIESGVEVGLLTDFGCGAFNNNPEQIAEIYKKLLLTEGYAKFFKKLEFNIINPANFNKFKKVFGENLNQEVKKPATNFFQSPKNSPNLNIPLWNANSSLAKNDYDKIKTLITSLQNEISSSWPYPLKGRKVLKLGFLKKLIIKANTNQPLEEVLKDLKQNPNYKHVIKGLFSQRTAELLDYLNKVAPQYKI